MQIRPLNGVSFFDLSALTSLDCHPRSASLADVSLVGWPGRDWICKEKDITLNEVVGYQVAAAVRLPLQPWIAFFRPGEHRGYAGMFIERWQSSAHADVCWPAKQRPDLVAAALALCVFDRFEWPVWLVSVDCAELRLIDLERIGPSLTWPPQRTYLRGYKTGTYAALVEAHEAACKTGLDDQFGIALRNLVQLDVAAVIDLSGHPNGQALSKVMVHGLEARQWELRRIIDGITRPRKRIPKRATSSLPRRNPDVMRLGVQHPQHGWLSGRIDLLPAPRRKWNVRWDIDTMDFDMELSSRWFGAGKYATKLNRALDDLERRTPRLRFRSYGGVRWGCERNMDEPTARLLIASVKRLWQEIIDSWQKHFAKRQLNAKPA